jgi:hypothetical protein
MKLLIKSTILFGVLVSLAAAVPPGTVPQAQQKKSARPAAAAPEPQKEITYDELAQYKGQRVIVHSKIGTTRSGKLTKYSSTQIDIESDGTGATFTFLRDAIKSLAVPVAPPETQSDGSAKKN